MKAPHEILGVGRAATIEEVRAAYHRLALRFHPDKHADNELRELAEEKFKAIHEAYEALVQPEAPPEDSRVGQPDARPRESGVGRDRLLRALEAYHAARYREALDLLASAAREEPLGPDALTLRGWCLLALMDDGCVDSFADAIRLAPDVPFPHIGLAAALIRRGELEAAGERLRIASELADSDAARADIAHWHDILARARTYRRHAQAEPRARTRNASVDLAPESESPPLTAGGVALVLFGIGLFVAPILTIVVGLLALIYLGATSKEEPSPTRGTTPVTTQPVADGPRHWPCGHERSPGTTRCWERPCA